MLIRACRDGSLRAIHHDDLSLTDGGVIPRRASRVEVIPAGPFRGRFHVDFALLAEETQNPAFCLCLAQTFARYDEAVKAEVAWLREHFILGEGTNP